MSKHFYLNFSDCKYYFGKSLTNNKRIIILHVKNYTYLRIMAKEIQGDFLKILVLSKVKELLNNAQKHKIILTDG